MNKLTFSAQVILGFAFLLVSANSQPAIAQNPAADSWRAGQSQSNIQKQDTYSPPRAAGNSFGASGRTQRSGENTLTPPPSTAQKPPTTKPSTQPSRASNGFSPAQPPATQSVTQPVVKPNSNTPPPITRPQPVQESFLGRSSGEKKVKQFSHCTVNFIDDIELPALETGQIKKLYVKEGDAVQSGKVVGKIDDELYMRMIEQAKLRLAIASQKANDSTSIKASQNEINLAEVEYRRTQSLAAKGSASQSEREKAEFSLKLAMLKKKAAENERDSAYGESKIEMSKMREVEERIRRHTMTSNFDGYVIEIFRHPLEWVNAGEKVMRIARMDKLWVQCTIEASELNPYEVMNREVTVTLDLARGQSAAFKGKIVHVGLERQSREQFLVKAEIDNRLVEGHWVLQPGSTVNMEIKLSPTAQASSKPVQEVPTLSPR